MCVILFFKQKTAYELRISDGSSDVCSSDLSDSRNISNIILASPDIDRETFERDISADVLAATKVARARHITAYVSLKDKALAASRAIHGYPRLGSPYCFDSFVADDLKARGLPVRCYAHAIPGLPIVDTTDVSRGSTGHSNFLRRPVRSEEH